MRLPEPPGQGSRTTSGFSGSGSSALSPISLARGSCGAISRALSSPTWERPFLPNHAGVREAREGFLKDRDVKEAIRQFPVRLTFERAMLHHLDGHPDDYPGALKALPPRLLSMFVSAFQSFLFNILLSRRCGQGIPLGEPAPGDRLLFPDGREDRVTRENLSAAILQVARKRARIGLFVPGSVPAPGPGQDGDPA